jgi:hypothetical protein
MPPTQTLSINKMRGFTVRVMRGFLVLASLPVLYVFVRTLQITRHLPRLDLAPARSPLLWLSVALMVAASLMIRFGPARIRLTAPYLWVLIVASFSVVAAVVVTFVVVSYKLLGTKLAVSPEKALLLGALELSLSILWCWWFFLSPAVAALRILATRLPPDGTLLTTVLASPLPHRDAADAIAPSKRRSPATVAYGAGAVALGFVAAVLVLWLFATMHIEQMFLALVLELATIYFVKFLWRRRRKHAAIDAHVALLNDPRRPILYLRSFQDDANTLSTEWDMFVRTGYGRAGRLHGPIARLVAMGGPRLEERLAAVMAPIGPFVAIGAPDEPLPQLGAARAYFTTDTWQSAVIDWVDMAQIIVKVAGPTHWIRWELDTILDRDAWPKLIILMPPSTPQDHAARWGNIVAALQDGPWGDALAGLDPRKVVAVRLLDEGALSVVTSDRRRDVDYVLATRIMLHNMQTTAPV